MALPTPNRAEAHAIDLRHVLHLGAAEPILDIVSLIEQLGVAVFLAPLPNQIAGLALRRDGEWCVAADTTRSVASRVRFTLAHELGHVVMKHEPSVDDHATLDNGSGSDAEIEANQFAAELLVPRGLVQASDTRNPAATALSLAQETGTSKLVAYYRMKNLQLIPDYAHATLDEAVKSMPAPEDTLQDEAARFARSSETRLPKDQVRREAHLAERRRRRSRRESPE